ncbi:LptM family lipoprotein [Methanococcoides methylutens]|uniref:LptM family lipoprotein n=1 Tax=Methanococcoides methylutens TaxID=2226 RepID=UPI004043E1C0
MKRMIFAILIIATMLLVSGCAQNGDVAEEGMDDVVVEDTADELENVDENVDDTVVDDPAESMPEDEGAPTEPDNTIPISQDDLDSLKEELEGLEFEDMGGLSEE